jgi:hypothetical protein
VGVLENFRAKYPEYSDLGDDQVIRALGEKYPEYRQDPDFNAAWLRVGGMPSLQPIIPGSEGSSKFQVPPIGSGSSTTSKEAPSSKPQEDAYRIANREFQAHLGWAGDDPELRSKAERIYKQRLGELGISYIEDIGPVEAFGKVIGPAAYHGAQALRAAVGDVYEGLAGSSGPGFLPLPNITSFANDPDAPLPIQRKISELEPGPARLAGKAGLALLGAPVPMGLAMLGGAVGLPQSAANLVAMGFDEEGKVDPVGALAAVGLPVTDKLGRDFVREAFFRKELFKFSPAGLKELFARVAKGEGSEAEKNLAKVIEEESSKFQVPSSKVTGIETGVKQKVAEVAGGLLADNVYMLGLQLPGILASEDPKQALESAVAGQLGWMFMGLPELMGKRAKYEGVRVEVGRGKESSKLQAPTSKEAPSGAEARVAPAARLGLQRPGGGMEARPEEVQTSGPTLGPAAPEEAPIAKQPWEMTREDYANVSPYPATQLTRAREHGRLVAAAVAAGQPVPQSVLDEYQEMLAGMGTSVPTAAAAAQTTEALSGAAPTVGGDLTGKSEVPPAPGTSLPANVPQVPAIPPHEGEAVMREEERPYATGALFASTGPGRKGRVPIGMAGWAHVRPMELPEIVRLAKELTGQYPKLKKFKRSGGRFYGATGLIKLNPAVFKNSVDAAKVLAHEVGHLTDYLPDRTLARGNLLGRIWSLRKFLKNELGAGGVKNKELRDELKALTMWWRPYDPANDPEWFVKYRESADELYADALSVLLNDPGALEARAPKFYKAFWRAIDRKPAVKRALFDLQDLLNQGKVALIDRRQGDIEAMFAKGEEVIRRKAEERALRRKSWKGHWLELKQQLADVYEPIVDRARKAEAAGAKWPPAEDPRNILESGLMVDNTNMRFTRRVWEGVIKPVEDTGLGTEELGRYLLLRRIQTQRAEIANPLGLTPATAGQQLLKMRLDLGMERMSRLEAAVQRLHDLVFEAVTTAVEVGSYNKETYDTTIVPNKDVYAAFANLDYLEDYVPAAIRKQVGMLGEIANPFTATVLKTITLNNLNSIQRSKNATRDLLRKYFPNEIEASPPAKADRGMLEVLEDGKRAYYYVDPLIAHAFERMSPQGLHRVLRVLDVIFRKGFYRAWITYGPSFLMFNPGRDFARSWQNMAQTPAGRPGALALALAYARTFQSAVSQVRGMPDALATEMMANYAIGAPHDTMVRGHREDAFGDLLRRFHLLPEKEQGGFMDLAVMRPVRKIGEALEFFGSLQETLPKMAVYRMLRERGLVPAAVAAHVRNFTGTPNIFKKGRAANVVRAVVPFYNVFLQGWRSDLQRMNPRSASGWLFKWAATDGVWAILAALASAGILGTALKELFGGASEYDKSNYNVIPVGWVAGGDYGKKTVYIRLPRSESSRLLSGLIYKLTRLLAGDSPEEWTSLLDFGAGQMPNVNPAVSVPVKWGEYLEGHQPVDSFRGRPIVPDTEWRAGGWDSLKPMLLWTWDQSGGGNFVKWDPRAQTASELVLSAVPGLNRVLKVSDYGLREEQRAAEREADAERARHRLAMPENVRQLVGEYMFLKGVDMKRRTPVQEARYFKLNVWYNAIYRPYDENITLAEQMMKARAATPADREKASAAAADARSALGKSSKGFERANALHSPNSAIK